MSQTLPAVISSLIVNVYNDSVRKLNPGLLLGNNAKRDRACLRKVTSRDALIALSRCGKDLDGFLARGHESDWAATPLVIPEIGALDFMKGVKALFSDDPAGVVRCCRQVLNLLAKLDVAAPPLNDEIDNFVARMEQVAATHIPEWKTLRCVGEALLQNLDLYDIKPSHGNGAVATGERNWEKMHFKRYYSPMKGFYPVDEFFYLNASHLASLPALANGLPYDEMEEQIAKLTAVPKDFRGLRIISEEPLEAMWLQQGQFRAMTQHLETHPLTRGLVNFHSQDVNRELALSSSITGDYVTLDLKDASDRVAVELVQQVFPKPVYGYLAATRSTRTKLPDGRLIRLSCFAPMGSACCFPVESVVFFAIVTAAIHDSLRVGVPSQKWLRAHRGDVYVYGDDIIVRKQYAHVAMDALSRCGFVLNPLKCCVGSHFRESCGQDAYDGQDVTPVRIKHLPDRRSAGSLSGSCDYLNRFKELGFLSAYDCLLQEVERVFGPIPRVSSPGDLGILVSRVEALQYNLDHFRSRYNRGLQRTEFLMPSIRAHVRPMETNCWSELFHCVLSLGSSQTGYTTPRRIQLIKRWRSC